MSKIRPRLGRGLNSLLSVAEEQAFQSGDGQSAGAGPGDLPVMREISVPHDPLSTAATTISEGNPPAENAKSTGQLPGDGTLLSVPVHAVTPNPHQPRRRFDEARLQELSHSLRESGLIQPIIVRVSPTLAGQYELIAGERRWRAATLAGLGTIPAIVRQVDVAAQARLALVENVQREDLNPIERASAYATLLDTLRITQQELAQQLGEDRTSITNYLRLLDLAAVVQKQIADGQLSAGHGKVLAGVSDIGEQCRFAELAVKAGLSVRALEQLIKQGSQLPAGQLPHPVSAHLVDLERSISRQIGMRIQIRAAGKNKSKGKLVIHYQSLDQFDQLLDRMDVRVEGA